MYLVLQRSKINNIDSMLATKNTRAKTMFNSEILKKNRDKKAKKAASRKRYKRTLPMCVLVDDPTQIK
jgi:hypothetical protein